MVRTVDCEPMRSDTESSSRRGKPGVRQQRSLAGGLAVRQERRCGERFPIALSLHFTIAVNKRTLPDGRGATVNLSSRGVLFTPTFSCPCGAGASVELSIAWPTQQDHPLILHIVGKIARSDKHGIAVQILRYRFRADALNPTSNSPDRLIRDDTGQDARRGAD
jgi:hypothetical protein